MPSRARGYSANERQRASRAGALRIPHPLWSSVRGRGAQRSHRASFWLTICCGSPCVTLGNVTMSHRTRGAAGMPV
ncbi:hypothetical protein EVAR_100226_1 [Eumeta japonica]|uniref:Uncharacterized protein n=1 Tax=Eumeta variegata TaxID=151549 RepID=A0A4C1T1Y1_EUMVA|nr:hypothetical protein EVAR_100226_1 [Eumeta japonica]